MMGSDNDTKLTIELLQVVIRKYEKDDTISVDSFTMEPGCGPGENYMSVTSRVHVFGKRKSNGRPMDYKRKIIVKEALKSELLRQQLNADVIFSNETTAYNTVVPKLEEYLRPLPLAACLYADHDMIILEDLCDTGYNKVPRGLTFDEQQSVAVLKALAKFHAASLLMESSDPEGFQLLLGSISEILFDPKKQNLEVMLEMQLKRTIKVLERHIGDAGVQEAIEEIKKISKGAFINHCKLISRDYKIRVINHGDCWTSNLLLNKSEAKLVDLQGLRYTSIGVDLNHFLYVNLAPSMRRTHMKHFLKVYHAELMRYLDGRVKNAQNTYTLAWVEGEVLSLCYHGAVMADWMLPVFMFDKNKLNLEELLAMDEEKNLEYFFENITPEFEQRTVEIYLEYMENKKKLDGVKAS